MEEQPLNSLSQQQQMILQQRKQQQQQQQMFLMQHIQQQKQQQQQQQQAITRFPSNIDAHLLSPRNLARPQQQQQQQQSHPSSGPNSNPVFSNLIQQEQQQQQGKGQNLQKTQQQQEVARSMNMVELQMAYQDAWRVCHPDFKRPFSSIEDACERLVAYHVVADYEAEEDERIVRGDRTGRVQSRSQQWDNNITAKISEFVGTFENQVAAFNIICRKRGNGELRSEERLMVEQGLLQEERRAMADLTRLHHPHPHHHLRPPLSPSSPHPPPHDTTPQQQHQHPPPLFWTPPKHLDLNSR